MTSERKYASCNHIDECGECKYCLDRRSGAPKLKRPCIRRQDEKKRLVSLGLWVTKASTVSTSAGVVKKKRAKGRVTGLNLFMKRHREGITAAAASRGAVAGRFLKMGSEMWNALTEPERAEWKNRASVHNRALDDAPNEASESPDVTATATDQIDSAVVEPPVAKPLAVAPPPSLPAFAPLVVKIGDDDVETTLETTACACGKEYEHGNFVRVGPSGHAVCKECCARALEAGDESHGKPFGPLDIFEQIDPPDESPVVFQLDAAPLYTSAWRNAAAADAKERALAYLRL